MNRPVLESATYRPVGRVVLRRIGADTLLVPVSGPLARDTKVYPLNDTGVCIWESLVAGQDAETTAATLAEQFEVEPGRALSDCVAFIRQLMADGLVEAAS